MSLTTSPTGWGASGLTHNPWIALLGVGGGGVFLFLLTYTPPPPPGTGFVIDPIWSSLSYPFALALLLGFVTLSLLTGVWPRGLKPNAVVLLFLAAVTLLLVGSVSSASAARFGSPPAVWAVLGGLLFLFWTGSLHQVPQPQSLARTPLGLLLGFCTVAAGVALLSVPTGTIRIGLPLASFDPLFPRVTGWFGNPNRFATAAGLGVLAAAFAVIFQPEGWGRRLAWMSLLLTIPALVLAASRGAMAAVVLALFVGLMALPRTYVMPALRRLFPVIVTALVAGTILGSWGIVRMGWDLETMLRLSTALQAGGRLEIWRWGLPLLAEASVFQFWLGRGTGAFLTETGLSAHNAYLRIAVDHGILFALLHLALLLALLSTGLRAMRTERGREEGFLVVVLVTFVAARDLTSPGSWEVRLEMIPLLLAVVLAASLRERSS